MQTKPKKQNRRGFQALTASAGLDISWANQTSESCVRERESPSGGNRMTRFDSELETPEARRGPPRARGLHVPTTLKRYSPHACIHDGEYGLFRSLRERSEMLENSSGHRRAAGARMPARPRCGLADQVKGRRGRTEKRGESRTCSRENRLTAHGGGKGCKSKDARVLLGLSPRLSSC